MARDHSETKTELDLAHPDRAPTAPAERFGRFVLAGAAGTGGMSEVRLAEEQLDNGERRACVIKRIAPAFARDTRFREMFLEEARVSRILDHPNVVRAFDTGEIDGVPFISFEVIDGMTLEKAAELAGGSLPPAILLETAIEALTALDHAHRLQGPDGAPLGLVHRDVSPQNILLTRAGRVKLIDFGIAYFRGRDHETRHGEIKGKVHYLAPEQVQRRPVDGRTDLFSLGIVLAEALRALKPPFSHSLTRELVDRPGPLPPALFTLLKRMTAADPSDRPESAAAAKAELEAIAESLGPRPSLASVFAPSAGDDTSPPEGRSTVTLPPAGRTTIDAEPTEEADLRRLATAQAGVGASPRTEPTDRTLPPTLPPPMKTRPRGGRRVWIGALILCVILGIAVALTLALR
ncbi:MAG: serine/threonine protein kinase [Deltaproteobacteria bacterium]|nr:serine/threonine protein kinase [Deltaproteobacteria bacterium]